MGKKIKKVRCICKGRGDRTLPGNDHQLHSHLCPMARNFRSYQ